MTKERNILMEIFSFIFFAFFFLLLSSNPTYAAERQKVFLQVSPSTQQLGGKRAKVASKYKILVQDLLILKSMPPLMKLRMKTMTLSLTVQKIVLKLRIGLPLVKIKVI